MLAVDDQGLVVAATASAHLGLAHNPVDAVADPEQGRHVASPAAGVPAAQPRDQVVPAGHRVAAAASRIGYPCVVKPVSRSGSQGVIRVDDDVQALAAAKRVRAIVGMVEPILVEGFVAGAEVAVEGLLVAGTLEVLAIFDKPDPLDGPFFEAPTRLHALSSAAAGPGRVGCHGGGGGRLAGVAGRPGARRAARRGPIVGPLSSRWRPVPSAADAPGRCVSGPG